MRIYYVKSINKPLIMPKNISLNYSPNFSTKRRIKKNIKFIVFHYTGMNSETKAIKRLTDEKSKVSCHYFIKQNGNIIQMVPDFYTSWHAGKSKWKKFLSINKYSIGIEIQNSGHNHIYRKFSKKQINSIIKISKYLLKKYRINRKNVLGHSDISFERKIDPGEKFPWKLLASKGIGFWHNFKSKEIKKLRNLKIQKKDELKFYNNLKKIGYSFDNLKKKLKIKLIKSFQRRFRQELINGKIDDECLKISKKLSEI